MSTCTLKILDEVNCQLLGLDFDTQKSCIRALRFFAPGARFNPAYKMGRWDGYISHMDNFGKTYNNLLDKLIPIIQKAGFEIDIEDLRDDVTYEWDEVDNTYLSHITYDNKPLVLRDEQVEVINTCLKNPQCVIDAATGLGKTNITGVLVDKASKYGRSIVIVPSIDLVVQTAEVLNSLGIDTGVYYGEKKEIDRNTTICTWQSLSSLYKDVKRGKGTVYKKFTQAEIDTFLDGVKCVILDEAHKASGKEIQKMLTGTFRNIGIRWGLTGTVPPKEVDRLPLDIAIGPVALTIDTKQLQENNILSECEINILELQDNSVFNNYADETESLITDIDRTRYLLDLISTLKDNGNTLVLVNRVTMGEMLESELKKRGVDVFFSHGEIKSKKRKAEYETIKLADNKVIIATYGVASTGIDIPRLFNLVLVDAGKSFTRVIQSIGRVLRMAVDKNFSTVWDICSSTKYSHKQMLERKRYYKSKQQKHNYIKVTDWK